ncbi:MAG: O-antigen ligase family protein [Blastocatellia bacterium]|nr:O-antigen ligase family protein [Blastocatellia bacterium]
MNLAERIEHAQFYLLLVLVCWSPLPFGSVEPWSKAVLQVGAALLLVGWAIRFGLGTLGKNHLPLPWWILVGGLGIGLCQLLPIQKGTPVSLSPWDTDQALMMGVAYAILLFTALQTLTTTERVSHLGKVLVVWGGGVAFFFVLQWLFGNGKYYWLFDFGLPVQPAQKLSAGPFINRNHYAGWVELVWPFPFLAMLEEKLNPGKKVLLGVGTFLLTVTVLVSGSRTGTLCLLLELFVSGWLFIQMGVRRQNLFSVAALVLGILLMIGVGWYWVGSEGISDRIQETMTDVQSQGLQSYDRPAIWRNSVKMIADHPWLGTGLGSFAVAYTQYDTGTGEWRLEHAHCDLLQIIVELGLAGGVLLLLFVGGLVQTIRAHLIWLGRQGTTSPPPAWMTGWCASMTACLGLLLHSLTDFNLQVPSNALLFLVLVAVAFGRLLESAQGPIEP